MLPEGDSEDSETEIAYEEKRPEREAPVPPYNKYLVNPVNNTNVEPNLVQVNRRHSTGDHPGIHLTEDREESSPPSQEPIMMISVEPTSKESDENSLEGTETSALTEKQKKQLKKKLKNQKDRKSVV